jgi:hypothetical protein
MKTGLQIAGFVALAGLLGLAAITMQRLQTVYDQGRLATSPLARDTFTSFQRARLSGDPVLFRQVMAQVIALCHSK